MALPPTALGITRTIDPYGIDVFEVTLSQGVGEKDRLLPDEAITAFDLSVTAEAAAAGLTILSEANHPPPTLTGLKVRYWLSIDPAQWSAGAFSGAGATLGIELSFSTSFYRRDQVTITHKVAQK